MVEPADGARRGALSDHERRGQKYLPPMAQLPVEVADSFRDDAPDFVWGLTLWAVGGEKKLEGLLWLQRRFSDAIGEHEDGHNGQPILDTRLSTLEDWTSGERQEHLETLVALILELDLVPDELLAILREYPEVPGAWLLLDPFANRELKLDDFSSLSTLARGLVGWAEHGHVEALCKFLTIAWQVQRRNYSTDKISIDALYDYPSKPEKFPIADSIIRASYRATQGFLISGGSKHDASAGWARIFWNTNWTLTSCIPADAKQPSEAMSEPAGTRTQPASSSPLTGNNYDDETTSKMMGLVDEAEEQLELISGAYFDAPTRNLYDPTRDEVIVGLLMRALKSVVAIARTPHLWSMPFAAGSVRLLAETEIMFAWFRAHPEDYAKYQTYGEGRAKLAWRHVEDILDHFSEGAIPSELAPVVDRIAQLKRDAPPLDLTVVSIESTFNGISLRKMASEVGLEVLYRSVFQSASGVIHGEWGSVRDHEMIRCVNPLHRFHLIPSLEPPWREDSTVPAVLLRQLKRLVTLGAQILNGSGH